MDKFTHASLFTGIGGFDYAAEKMGWENLFWCEREKFCQTVLKYHYPNSKGYEDIKQTDFSIWRGKITVLTGGFPCQPYSQAGARKGTDDERHLWPEMLRAIREIQPPYVVAENVSGLLTWSDGLVFEQICTDLENEGYQVQAFLIPACGKNAPHQRERLWFVAYSNRYGNSQQKKGSQGEETQPKHLEKSGKRNEHSKRITELAGFSQSAIHSDSKRLQKLHLSRITEKQRQWTHSTTNEYGELPDWGDFPTQQPICGGNDGISERLSAETLFEGKPKRKNRNAFITWNNSSIHAYGNAIVPQIAFEIYKAIEQVHYSLNNPLQP